MISYVANFFFLVSTSIVKLPKILDARKNVCLKTLMKKF